MISVILPFFNAENTLANAIHSILEQSEADFELILVNNNSTDKSTQIAQSFTDECIRYISEAKQGVMHTFNAGLRTAQGKLPAWMPMIFH